ncbi:MAG: hypothetical protein HUK02_05490 [Bacteroidaceae bacterium]|nr:hypothetical protein [Bacteroidaceae bacterium]
MKRMIWTLAALVLMASCRREDDILPRTREVLVIYMMAENSLSGYAGTDLGEIRSARQDIPADCRVVVLLDDANPVPGPRIFSIDRKGEQEIERYGHEIVSTDSVVIKEALQTIVRRCPADNYSLVLWSHGSGWAPAPERRRTIGIDNDHNWTSNVGKETEISELRWALEQSGVHWRYVMFDACFMQCAEVAYELRNVTDWMIGSPAEIPAMGAPYDELMPAFFSSRAPEEIASVYYDYYENTDGLVISAVKTSAMEALRTATLQCLDTVAARPIDDVQQYGMCLPGNGYLPEFYDISSAMYHWLSPAHYAQWRAALEAAVPYRHGSHSWRTEFTGHFYPVLIDPDHFSGLSFYVPIDDEDHRLLTEEAARTSWWRR